MKPTPFPLLHLTYYYFMRLFLKSLLIYKHNICNEL